MWLAAVTLEPTIMEKTSVADSQRSPDQAVRGATVLTFDCVEELMKDVSAVFGADVAETRRTFVHIQFCKPSLG